MSQPIKLKQDATPKERHAYAMGLAEQAMRCNDTQKALELNCEAFDIERKIAESIPENKENEPSRSIMYRSSATLALNVGFLTRPKS